MSSSTACPSAAAPAAGERGSRCRGITRTGRGGYRCPDCKRAFSPLTGTVFDARKMPVSEWIETRSTFLSFIRLRVREGKRKREINRRILDFKGFRRLGRLSEKRGPIRKDLPRRNVFQCRPRQSERQRERKALQGPFPKQNMRRDGDGRHGDSPHRLWQGEAVSRQDVQSFQRAH